MGVTLPTLAAPVAEPLRLNTIYIASGVPSSLQIPWSDRKEVYETITFAGVKVISDDSHLTRMDKARKIAEFLSSANFKPELRSCTKIRGRKTKKNCSRCEKCLRTILELILAGIDPNKVGFEVNYTTVIRDVKRIIEIGRFTRVSIHYWSEIFKEAQKPSKLGLRHFTSYDELKALEKLWKINTLRIMTKREDLLRTFILIARRLYYTTVALKLREKLHPLENIFNSLILEVLSRIIEGANRMKSEITRK